MSRGDIRVQQAAPAGRGLAPLFYPSLIFAPAKTVAKFSSMWFIPRIRYSVQNRAQKCVEGRTIMTNTNEATLLPVKAALSRFRVDTQSRLFGVYVALASLAAVAVYVFAFTPYQDFLYNDMRAYWVRAMDRLNGEIFTESQFIAWPPGYHILLAELFRVCRWLGLDRLIRLETALTINILAFAGSVYAFQRIAVRWFRRPKLMLTTLLLYGFGFPAFYFHAFLLPDNLAASLLVIAIAAVFCRDNWKSLVIAAVLFAVATIIRPSIGPYGLSFVIFFFIRWKFGYRFIARAAVFSAVFFTLIAGASAEVSRISGGKVQGISISGGLDFFIANSRYYRIDLNYDGWHNFVVVPALSFQPENGRFYSQTPYYHRDYYFKLGWGFITHNPVRLLKNFEHVRNLFFADMLPSKREAPGFTLLRPLWDWFKFGMFLALGLYIWLWRALEPEHRPLFGLLMSTIGLTLLVSYLFTGEPRYTYSIIFMFYLLFFKLVEYFQLDWPRWKASLAPFAVMLALGTGVAFATPALLEMGYPPTVQVDVAPLQPGSEQAQHYTIERVLFPYSEQPVLNHISHDHPPLTRAAKVMMHTNLTITGNTPLNFWFDICSRWPYRILIDGKPWSPDNNPLDYFQETNVSAYLQPGVHTVAVVVDYTPIAHGGFAISYNYFGKDNWRYRKTLGIDSKRIHFSLPKVTEAAQTASP